MEYGVRIYVMNDRDVVAASHESSREPLDANPVPAKTERRIESGRETETLRRVRGIDGDNTHVTKCASEPLTATT